MGFSIVNCALLGLAAGSHFRFGTISWAPLGGNSAQISMETAWRRSFSSFTGSDTDGLAHEGDSITTRSGGTYGEQKFYYGDNTDTVPDVEIQRPWGAETAASLGRDMYYDEKPGGSLIGVTLLDHTYATPNSGGDPWVCGFQGCCRLGARPDGDPNTNIDGSAPSDAGLNNNGFRKWNVQSKIDLSAGPNNVNSDNESPFAAGRPLLRLRIDYNEIFDIICVDNEDDGLTWRLGNAREHGSPTIDGDPDNMPPGYGTNLHRDGTPMTESNKMVMLTNEYLTDEGEIVRLGIAEWDTNGLQTGYWQATVMIDSAGPNGKEGQISVPYDYLMLLVFAKGNEPPVWIDPTPAAVDEVHVDCPGSAVFTMRADDPQKGQEGGEAGAPADSINIFLVNVPPMGFSQTDQYVPPNDDGNVQAAIREFYSQIQGLEYNSFSKELQNADCAGSTFFNANCQAAGLSAGEMNPVEQVFTWPVTCANAGTRSNGRKYILCFQAEDDNGVQPLDSRVRCVIIRVLRVQNEPPVYCGDTPNDNDLIPVCVGKSVSFNVDVCDENLIDTVSIEFTSGVPDAAVLSDIAYNPTDTVAGQSTGRRTFTLAPSGSIQAGEVCFNGSDDKGAETGPRCVLLSIRYPPVFIAPTPMETTGAEGQVSAPELTAYVCEEVSYEVHARDANTEDDVSIFVLEDPGVPNGAVVEQNVCPPPGIGGEGGPVAVACNPVSRRFSWTPVKTQEGKTYKVCYVARDNKSNCMEGGYYSLDTACVTVTVVAPHPVYNYPITPTTGTNMNAYVGAISAFSVSISDPIYGVGLSVSEEYPLPPDATFSVCAAGAAPGGERRSLQAATTCTRNFGWKPKRGMEGYSYQVCFNGGDEVCDSTEPGHDGHVQSTLTRMTTLDWVCVNLNVIRCKYAVNEGDTLHYLSKYYHLDTNWLRIWNSNGNDDLDAKTDSIHNPDMILHEDDIINVGPVYKVQTGDTMVALAARFHTTVKKIISVNPDLAVDEAGGVVVADLQPGQDLCVLPCTDSPHVHSNTYKYAY